MSEMHPRSIVAVGITNQRETLVMWDRRTGEPVANAIVWQCRRSAPICDRLKADGTGGYRPLQDRPADRPLLHRRQDKVASGQHPRRPAARRARRPRLRYGRLLAGLEPNQQARSRDRRHQRQPHHAVRYRRDALGSRVAVRAGGTGGRFCPRSARPAKSTDTSPAICPPVSPYRSRVSPETSRRPSSDRRVSSLDRPRTPTGQAVSCSPTPERAE